MLSGARSGKRIAWAADVSSPRELTVGHHRQSLSNFAPWWKVKDRGATTTAFSPGNPIKGFAPQLYWLYCFHDKIHILSLYLSIYLSLSLWGKFVSVALEARGFTYLGSRAGGSWMMKKKKNNPPPYTCSCNHLKLLVITRVLFALLLSSPRQRWVNNPTQQNFFLTSLQISPPGTLLLLLTQGDEEEEENMNSGTWKTQSLEEEALQSTHASLPHV